jgi:peroxiredoxin Q/BCP
MLNIGDAAPDFDVVAHDGRRLKLSEYRGKKNVVLYFYPKDFTLVCTKEACGFRDMYDDLLSKETEVIGVSIDDDASHEKFAHKHGVLFPLVADTAKKLAKAYGAVSRLRELLGGTTARITYIIDKQGKIAGVYSSDILASQHLNGVKKTIAELA